MTSSLKYIIKANEEIHRMRCQTEERWSLGGLGLAPQRVEVSCFLKPGSPRKRKAEKLPFGFFMAESSSFALG